MGRTNIDNNGALTIPPTIGAAIRCMISAPVPLDHMMGKSPARITATVIALGRTRSTAPSMSASSSASAERMPSLPLRRAIAAEVFTTGEFEAPVPTENYGVKFAYRRSVARDWLVMETRVSCTFPRELLTQERITNWGVGIGFEMFFGTSEFLARPVTF